MGLSVRKCSLLFLLFFLNACRSGVNSQHEIIIENALSLPTPASYDKIISSGHLIVFKSGTRNTGYRWIDKDEIEFIGSSKSPYEFFKAALNDPEDDEEERFVEGLGTVQDRLFASDNKIEVYLFDMGDRHKIYVLSSDLNFVTEITSRNELRNLFEGVVRDSYIQ